MTSSNDSRYPSDGRLTVLHRRSDELLRRRCQRHARPWRIAEPGVARPRRRLCQCLQLGTLRQPADVQQHPERLPVHHPATGRGGTTSQSGLQPALQEHPRLDPGYLGIRVPGHRRRLLATVRCHGSTTHQPGFGQHDSCRVRATGQHTTRTESTDRSHEPDAGLDRRLHVAVGFGKPRLPESGHHAEHGRGQPTTRLHELGDDAVPQRRNVRPTGTGLRHDASRQHRPKACSASPAVPLCRMA